MLYDEPAGALSYLLADADAGEAVLIDPRGQDVAVLLALLAERELQLRWVLRTHQHDRQHPQEPRLLARLGAPLVQGTSGAGRHATGEGAVLTFGHEYIRVLATPGHTPDCLSFAWRDRLFCGDLLAVTGCGQQKVPAAPKALWDSVTQKVFTLPDETLLFAAHAEQAHAVSTVLEQRRSHPLFSGLSRDEFLARMADLQEQIH